MVGSEIEADERGSEMAGAGGGGGGGVGMTSVLIGKVGGVGSGTGKGAMGSITGGEVIGSTTGIREGRGEEEGGGGIRARGGGEVGGERGKGEAMG